MASPEVVTRARGTKFVTAPGRRRGTEPTLTGAENPAVAAESADRRPPAVIERLRWQRHYAGRLLIVDIVVVTGTVVLAQYLRFSSSASTEVASGYVTAYSILVATLWLSALAGFRTRSPKIIGTGLEEYRRLCAASFATFGALAIAELLLKLEISRGYLAVALPGGIIGLLLGRWLGRKHLSLQRSAGACRTAVLAIGDCASVTHLAAELTADPADGYQVVGVCIPGYDPGGPSLLTVGDCQLPIVGGENNALSAIGSCGADTVAIAGTGQVGVPALRRLIWELEPMGVDLMVCPGVMDVALSRLVMRPISGLPLLQIEKPQYRGAKRFQKRAFDFCFALAALAVTFPVLVVAAAMIKITSRGPVFYSAERIGIDGRPFAMLKFRSMIADADQYLDDLLARNEGDGVLFKIRDDPRITPVGRVLRRFSIDELPQFINVLKQEMSVVGPRPPLRREVEAYDCDVLRRLLVKPGITGLWQVSGRSDLSWDTSIRLDLSYVDNWSMIGDLVIIAKTLRAVVQRKGAY
ncbi:sugar transferase [Mycobacterium sp. PSTR-4-N]|uniref:sugar transferase n=1 Tax=Mycobacterium sp. PSTR-4-N TaxID=2917745 RepID=UPI001F14A89C|nr:sugar transferase [Mycobacterium sp. PSTR-4-N]MCG7595428.1 sugar transferase [Mycobacterium sp. PSTR-4-N]